MFLSILFGCLTLWPFVTHAGIPVYQHDWSWSPEPIRFRDGLLQLVSTWNEEGLGHANSFATANPVAIATVAFGLLISPKIGLSALLTAICVVAGTGAMVLTRFASGSRAGAIIAGFLYLASPVFFNKVSAGQITYTESYAIFPWVVFCTIRAIQVGGAARFVALALVCGVSCVQPQFFLFGVIQAIVFAVTLRGRRAFAVVACVACSELVLNLPTVYSALALNYGFAFTIPHPIGRYEYLQSAAPADAVRMVGYIIPYATNAYARAPFGGVAQFLLWAVPCIALTGFAAALRNRLAQGALLLCAVGIILSTGERGPLAGAFVWGFTHLSAAALLREFYHSSVLTACGFAFGTAFAVAAFPRTAIPVGLTYLFAFFPFAFPGHSADLHFAKPPSGQVQVNEFLRAQPPGRVLPYPYKMPLQLGHSEVSGVDVFSYSDREHMLASEYAPTPQIDAVARMIADGMVDEAAGVLRRYGVRYIEWRRWLRSAYPDSLLEPEQRRYRVSADGVFNATIAAYARLTRDAKCFHDTCIGVLPQARPILDSPTSVVSGVLDWTNAKDQTVVELPPLAGTAFSNWHLTPMSGWVSAAQWNWASPRWAQMVWPLAVTGAARPDELRIHVVQPSTVPYTGGPLHVCREGRCQMRDKALHAGFEIGRNASVVAHGPAALGMPFRTPHIGALHRAYLNYTNPYPWLFKATLHGAGQVLVVLRTRFDQGWALSGLPIRERLSVDSGLNGWIVDAGDRGGPLTISYGPQRTFFFATIIEAALYCVLIILALIVTGKSRRVC